MLCPLWSLRAGAAAGCHSTEVSLFSMDYLKAANHQAEHVFDKAALLQDVAWRERINTLDGLRSPTPSDIISLDISPENVKVSNIYIYINTSL